MAAVENQESNLLSFGPIKRDAKSHVPYTSSKLGIRGDLIGPYWDMVNQVVEENNFKQMLYNERLAKITGAARLKVPIRGKCSVYIIDVTK